MERTEPMKNKEQKTQMTMQELKKMFIDNVNGFEQICNILDFTEKQRNELKNNFQNIREIINESFNNKYLYISTTYIKNNGIS